MISFWCFKNVILTEIFTDQNLSFSKVFLGLFEVMELVDVCMVVYTEVGQMVDRAFDHVLTVL